VFLPPQTTVVRQREKLLLIGLERIKRQFGVFTGIRLVNIGISNISYMWDCSLKVYSIHRLLLPKLTPY
jgi:hypothetical protein